MGLGMAGFLAEISLTMPSPINLQAAIFRRESEGDRGRACVWKPIFPCLIYILHFCKIMLRVFW